MKHLISISGVEPCNVFKCLSQYVRMICRHVNDIFRLTRVRNLHCISTVSLILPIIPNVAIRADLIPTCAFGCNRLYQADSCNMNMVLFFVDPNCDSVDALLETADHLDMPVILAHARRPGTPDITYISGGQRFVYQAESDTFDYHTGSPINDLRADRGTALAVVTSKYDWLQKDLWTNEQRQSYTQRLKYYAYFKLKINNNRGTTPVCSLIVRRKEKDKVFNESFRVLARQDFHKPRIYDTFLVDFEVPNRTGILWDYAVRYLKTNDSLFCDNVQVMDYVANRLTHGYYDNTIKLITQYYNNYRCLFRYYLWDEPTVDRFWASSTVNSRLKETPPYNISGIQVVPYKELFHAYLDSVNTGELLVDYYPLTGTTFVGGRTPVDSGNFFQSRLSGLCEFLGEARLAVKSHPGTHLWFMPQAFGHAITTSAYEWDQAWNHSIPVAEEGWYREPSPREMRCIIWLALTYGVRGFFYYLYQSITEQFVIPQYEYKDHHWIIGLTDSRGNVKRPLWYTVKGINAELRMLSDVLSVLEPDTVFKSDKIPGDCYITNVTDSLMQIGTFHDKKRDYFMIVNRHCLPKETIDVRVSIAYATKIHLQDCLTAEKIFPNSTDTLLDFRIRLLPGQGRLFRLVPQ